MHVSTTPGAVAHASGASTSTVPERRTGSTAGTRQHGGLRRFRCRADLIVAGLSATLLPVLVVVAIRLTDEGGLARILIAVLIAALGASTVCTAAGARLADRAR